MSKYKQTQARKRQEKRPSAPTSSTPQSDSPSPAGPLPDHATTRPLRQSAVQQMQQTQGNQYVQRQLGLGSSSGGTPAAIQRIAPLAAAELGIAIFSAGAPVVLSGNLSSSAATINYMHENTPPDAQWTRATTSFRLSVWNPRPLIGGQEWVHFRLSYEYNGNDLRDVSVVCLQDESMHLTTSTFSINFTGMAHSPSTDPKATIRYQIGGVWDPAGRGIDSFWGYLQVKSDGSVSLMVESEQGWVSNRSDAFGEITTEAVEGEPAPETPEPPPPPEPVLHLTDITFTPGGDQIEGGDEEALVRWYLDLPEHARRQIEAGSLQIVVEGHASTTQPGPANRLLSRRRAQRVVEILQDIAGSDARFRTFARGEYQAGTPDEVEDESERVVIVSVEIVEEAASGSSSGGASSGG
jgi:outer membrane protein OmpA-like peptidoglycan-associated protein